MPSRIASLGRLGRIGQIFVRHGLLGLVDQLGLQDASLVMRHERGDLAAARFGRRLSRALNDLGPTFVKLGQFLSVREDLFPPAVTRELAELQDQTTTLPGDVVRRHIAEALGRSVETAFADFDGTPLAAGSIAQVHRARTHDGLAVVVKVRRPGIDRVIESDLALLAILARQAAARSPEIARLDPVGLVGELGASLTLELDLAREARCLAAMRRELGRTAYVPRVVEELSAASVLTMEWIDGVKLSALAPEVDRRATARAVVACFATQYLRAEMFHGDPHAGNLLRRADGRLVLLDLGATGAIDEAMRRLLLRMAAAAARRDGEALADVVLSMVHAPPDLDRAAYRRDLGGVLETVVRDRGAALRIGELIRKIFAIAQQHHLRLRAEFFTLFRSAMLVDGVLRGLDPTFDPIGASRAFILRQVFTPRWFVPATGLVAQTAAARVTALVRRRRGVVIAALLVIVATIALLVAR